MQVVEACGEIRPIACGAGGTILEFAFAASRLERVELAVEHLATSGRGEADVADEAHGVV